MKFEMEALMSDFFSVFVLEFREAELLSITSTVMMSPTRLALWSANSEMAVSLAHSESACAWASAKKQAANTARRRLKSSDFDRVFIQNFPD